ncbi:hypothetical protein VTI74DRAFT_4257 [Chaetomium olivicolor]
MFQATGNFTFFPRLPIELQDAIWNIAVTPAPTAHFACFQREKKDRRYTSGVRRPWGAGSWRSRYYLSIQRFLPPGLDNPPPWLDVLRRVCRRSLAAVHRHEIRLLEPFQIEAGETQDPKGDHLTLPPITIDSALDLVILHPNWSNTARRIAKPPEFALPEIRHPMKAQLRYLAIPWCAPWAKWSKKPAREAVEGLLAPFFRLHVLYVVLEPEDLKAARRPCSSEDEICVEEYVAAYKGDHASPTSFRYGGRVYYELLPTEVQELGGLVGMMKVFNTVREKRNKPSRQRNSPTINPEQGREAKILRTAPSFYLMSWR